MIHNAYVIDTRITRARTLSAQPPVGVSISTTPHVWDRPLVGFLRRRLKIFVTLRNAVP
jgi:hypothetical protein